MTSDQNSPGNQRQTSSQPKQRKDSLVIGTVLKNRYRTVSYLGRGGMSNVYKALDARTGRTVAVKVLHSELLQDETRVKRFFQEAKTYRNLRHKHIIKLYDFFTDEADRHCIVMEFMEGKNLSETLDERGKLTVRRAIKIFTEICQALGYAHKQGVVHRDLKPSNIALVEKGGDADYVKILDFGIAKMIPSDTDTLTDLGLTQTGEIVGSPLYMSPEQCMAKHIDLRSDIYSLGCLMYEALTGQPPLIGGNVYETFHMQTHEKPKPLAELRPEFKDGTQLETIILKCMAKNPKHRYSSMNQVIDALSHVGSYNPSGAVSKAITAWREKQIEKRAEKGKTLNPIIVAVLTTLVVGASGYAFRDNIIKIIEPAERRYHNAVQKYDDAMLSLNYSQATEASKRALDIAENENQKWLLPSLIRTIDLYRITGKYKVADMLYDRAEKLGTSQKKDVFKGEEKLLKNFEGLIKLSYEEAQEKDEIEEYCYQLNDIASGYMDAGLWRRAKSLLKKTINMAKEVLPENNLVIINLNDNLAILSLKDNLNERYPEVKANLEKAIERRKEIAGRTSAGLFTTLKALSEVNLRMNELKDAKSNALEALSIARNTYRPTSPQATEAKCQLAKVYLAQGKVDRALTRLNTLETSLERSADIPNILRAQVNVLLGEALHRADEFDKSIEQYEQALQLLTNRTDTEILLKADVYRGLGDIYSTRARKDVSKAEAYYLNALMNMLRSNEREEQKVLTIVSNLSTMFRQKHDTTKIEELYKLCEHVDKVTGKTNGVIEDKLLLAEFYREKRKLKTSSIQLEEALSLAQSFYGFKSAKAAEISSLLAHTYMLRNDYKQARILAIKPVELIRSDNLKGEISRSVKLKILSTYKRYLEHVDDTEELVKVEEEINQL